MGYERGELRANQDYDGDVSRRPTRTAQDRRETGGRTPRHIRPLWRKKGSDRGGMDQGGRIRGGGRSGRVVGDSPPLLASVSSGEVAGNEPQRDLTGGGVADDGCEVVRRRKPPLLGAFLVLDHWAKPWTSERKIKE